VDDLEKLWDKFVNAAEKGDHKVAQLIPKIEKAKKSVTSPMM
jgi:hypothetical protein